MVDTVSSTSSRSGATSTSPSTIKDAEALNKEFNQFLNLLTTQLKNQDPTSPMDTNQMTAQLVQFTAVEQQMKANTFLESLLEMQGAAANANAVSYIGKEVTFGGNTTTLGADGARWGYTVDPGAAKSTVNVFNKAGDLVYSAPGETATGKLHEFVWNGIDKNGQQAPEGTYYIYVDALDAKNQGVDTSVEATGVVTGVLAEDGKPSLLVGGVNVALEDVTRVSAN